MTKLMKTRLSPTSHIEPNVPPHILKLAKQIYFTHRADLALIVPDKYSSWGSLPLELKQAIVEAAIREYSNSQPTEFLEWSLRLWESEYSESLIELGLNGADLWLVSHHLFCAVSSDTLERYRITLKAKLESLRSAISALERAADHADAIDPSVQALMQSHVSARALREQLQFMRITESVISTRSNKKYSTEDYLIAKIFTYISAAYHGKLSKYEILASTVTGARLAAGQNKPIDADAIKKRIARFKKEYPERMLKYEREANEALVSGNGGWTAGEGFKNLILAALKG